MLEYQKMQKERMVSLAGERGNSFIDNITEPHILKKKNKILSLQTLKLTKRNETHIYCKFMSIQDEYEIIFQYLQVKSDYLSIFFIPNNMSNDILASPH